MHKIILMPLLVGMVSLASYAFWATPASAQTPHVVSTSPAQNELNVPVSTNISVTFDVNMNETTIDDSTFVVNARSTGTHPGTITYDGPTQTATFDPFDDFDVGEVVTLVLTTDIQSSEGTPLEDSYVWSFTIVVNDGSGTFVPDSVYPVGVGPWSVFAADLDGDGDLDLTTANVVSDDVSVLLNNGNGTFAPHLDYPVGDDPHSVFAADLDGDSDLDLAAANWGTENVSVLLNDGDGTFAPHSVYPVGDKPHSVFAADLDGDGDLDLATANLYIDNVSLLLNNGNGSFAPHSDYPVADGPNSVFAADLDGDGDIDLTTANLNSDNVSVLLNALRGDTNADGIINVGDVVYLVSYLYKNGPAPSPIDAGDCNCDDIVNVGDVVYLVSYLYRNGPPPGCPKGSVFIPQKPGGSTTFILNEAEGLTTSRASD